MRSRYVCMFFCWVILCKVVCFKLFSVFICGVKLSYMKCMERMDILNIFLRYNFTLNIYKINKKIIYEM